MSKISIITTTYKHKDFIAYTIESILAQTYSDWELLIGDDSPDNDTRDIIQEYVIKYPHKIQARHHSPNKGIVDNTNFLIGKVSDESDYIAFLEGDDMYTPDNLEEKMKVFERHPEVALVYSDLSFIDRNNKIILESFFQYRRIPYYQNQIIPKEDFIMAGAGPIASRSTSIIKKEVLLQFPIRSLNPSNKTYSVSDYDIYFQITVKYPVFGINKALTQYRRHSNNLSGASGGTSADLEILIHQYKNDGLISDELFKKKMSWIYIVYAIFALEDKNKKKALRDRKSSFHYNFFSFFIWKIGLTGLLLLPKQLSKVILDKLIKRG